MNGGRGAKGSINDRLISIMYRNRYKLAEDKKAGYTVVAKEKQKEYLKSMQNFNYPKDVSNLDSTDKKSVNEAVVRVKAPAVEQSQNPKEETVSVISSPISDDIRAATYEETFTAKPTEQALNSPVPFHPEFERKTAELKETATTLENSSSPSIETISELSDKMIDVDLTTEVFDFEHYDYYQVVTPKKGANIQPTSPTETFVHDDGEILDIESEIQKVEDEEVILTEHSTLIEDSQEVLVEIKEELSSVRDLIGKSETQPEIAALEAKYQSIRSKVEKLKAQYDVVKEKYDFEDFKILESIEMMAAIEDYKDRAALDELETMVDVCKEEIDQIDGILIEEKKSIGIAEDIEEQRREVTKRDQEFEQNKSGVIYLDDLERKIAQEAREQAQLLLELEKKLADFQTETVTVTHTVNHTERIIGSFFRIAAGILTVPFSGRNVFGTLLGVHLINRGTRQLRDALNPEFVQTTEVRHRYHDIEREILNSKDYVDTTAKLIDDSMYQLDCLEEEFKFRFSAYSSRIPQYAEVEKKIEEVKKRLSLKKEDVKHMQKTLDRQYEENKVKVKRAA